MKPDVTLRENLVAVYGQMAINWLNELPALLDKLALSKQLRLLKPFKDLSFNYVLPVLGQNEEAWVLKLGLPQPEFAREIRALRHYNGKGCVRLIDANADAGWMIMERCIPGTRLVDIDDEEQCTAIAVSVMQQLWRPVAEADVFPSLKEWLSSLKRIEDSPMVSNLISKRLRDFVTSCTKELLTHQDEAVLLHGDFHHYNILQHSNQWTAIDPKGIVGEREYEIGAFLRNPITVIETPQEKKEIARKLDLMIELTGFHRTKVLSWSIIQAVLCVCWCCEDNMPEKAQPFAAFSEKLYAIYKSTKGLG